MKWRLSEKYATSCFRRSFLEGQAPSQGSRARVCPHAGALMFTSRTLRAKCCAAYILPATLLGSFSSSAGGGGGGRPPLFLNKGWTLRDLLLAHKVQVTARTLNRRTLTPRALLHAGT